MPPRGRTEVFALAGTGSRNPWWARHDEYDHRPTVPMIMDRMPEKTTALKPETLEKPGKAMTITPSWGRTETLA